VRACHSDWTTLRGGIGRRRDGWANRDLDVGTIVSLAPDLSPFTSLLGVDEVPSGKCCAAGPGTLRRAADKDGKAFRPDGKQAGTLIRRRSVSPA
jgi:hypothetical protein